MREPGTESVTYRQETLTQTTYPRKSPKLRAACTTHPTPYLAVHRSLLTGNFDHSSINGTATGPPCLTPGGPLFDFAFRVANK